MLKANIFFLATGLVYFFNQLCCWQWCKRNVVIHLESILLNYWSSFFILKIILRYFLMLSDDPVLPVQWSLRAWCPPTCFCHLDILISDLMLVMCPRWTDRRWVIKRRSNSKSNETGKMTSLLIERTRLYWLYFNVVILYCHISTLNINRVLCCVHTADF